MRPPIGAFLVIAVTVAGSAAAEAPAISHAGVGCVVAEKFPRLEARIAPADAVARAVVHFRTDPARPWYAMAMKAEGEAFSGVLPKPKGSLKAFQYYIDVTDRGFATSRTPEYTTTVVTGPGACKGKMMAGAMGSASILLEVPAGAPLVPAGFASAGVAAAGSGTAAASAAGAAGGGGAGIGTVAAIVGGGAAVAGAVVAVKAAGGDDHSSDGGESAQGVRIYSVMIPLPGLDVSACASSPLSWTSQNVSADANGRFDTTWAPSQPNTLRVVGTVTDTAFNATLNCVSGNGSGSLAATGSGGTYQGTFNFNAQRGSITVVRSP
ncbi:MAG TPA: hypothetical protein VEQ84_00880 [Vicinamibacteria bacterium]|nr:hypothetical protein [Vicinamibacteria bacterium]